MGQYQKKREKLHNILLGIVPNVYFNPPNQLKYPCIVYGLGAFDNRKADNKNYKRDDQYSLVLICQSYLNDYVDKLEEIDYCHFNRHYISDNLHHFSYTIYIN